jgi:hypothetical protein
VGPLARIKALDNNLWLWAKVRTNALVDRLGAPGSLAAEPARFDDLACYCSFIGYPRSGHSLVASILDAHPEAVFAHRLDALRYFAVSPPEVVLQMIVRNAERFASNGRRLTAYSYPVAGQWQGRSRRLRVIGDQEAKWTTIRLSADPHLLRKVTDRYPARLRFVHVVRNPFDNIATLATRTQRPLAHAAKDYFRLCDGVRRIKAVHGGDVLDVYHEDMIANPPGQIARLCDFVGLDASPEYVAAASALIHEAPNRTRHSRAWTSDLIEGVTARAAGFNHLSRYSFSN